MKNKTKIIICAVIAIIVLFGILFALGVALIRSFFSSPLKTTESETGYVPAYVVYGDLHLPDRTIGISQICRQQNPKYSFGEIFCIAAGKVFSVCIETADSSHNWLITSIDLETSEFSVCCSFDDAKDIYSELPYEEYSKRNGYFYNGVIVLNDFETVFTYDIETGDICEFAYEGYEFPQKTIYREYIKEQTIALHMNEDVYTFTLQEMAQTSKGIAEIFSLRNKYNWDKSSYLVSFLCTDTIQIISGEIYTLDSILNFWGTPFGVILKYDQDSNSWHFITQCILGDNKNHCYLIENTGDGVKPLKK